MPLISISDAYNTGKKAFKDVVSTGSQLVRYVSPRKKRVMARGNFKKTVNYVRPPNMNLYVKKDGALTERKFLDVTSAGIYADTVLSFQLVNGLGEGSGPSDRIGRIIENRTLSLRLTCVSPTDKSCAKVRVLVILDKQPNGAIFSVGDVFAATGYPADSFYGLKNRDRFRVLKDVQWVAAPIDASTVGRSFKNFGISLRGIKTIYSQNQSDITGISTNSIYIVICSSANNAGAQETKPLINFYSRFRYYDA